MVIQALKSLTKGRNPQIVNLDPSRITSETVKKSTLNQNLRKMYFSKTTQTTQKMKIQHRKLSVSKQENHQGAIGKRKKHRKMLSPILMKKKKFQPRNLRGMQEELEVESRLTTHSKSELDRTILGSNPPEEAAVQDAEIRGRQIKSEFKTTMSDFLINNFILFKVNHA